MLTVQHSPPRSTVLKSLLRSYSALLHKLGDAGTFTALSFATYLFVFWGYHALLNGFVYSGRLTWLRRFKVHDKEPTSELAKKALQEAALGSVVQVPLLYILYQRFWSHIMPMSLRTLPGLQESITYLVAWHALFDTWFYWGHRCMHMPALYGRFHKQHHEFHASVGIAATYAHKVEELLVNIPSTLIGPVLLPRHGLLWLLYLALRLHETVDAHCGYDWPWSIWRWCPFHGGCRRHDFHHSHNSGNFGGFVVWDRICGTDVAYRRFCICDAYWWTVSYR